MKKKVDLFSHIKQITEVQNKNYWNTLSDYDKKSFNNYIINRFLSMKGSGEWIDIVNEFQKYNLRPRDLYKLYINILPKGKQWLKYTKGKKSMKYEKWLLEIVAKYYESSLKEAQEYLEVFYSTEQNKANLKSILQKYGVEPKELKKLNLP